MTDKPPLAGLEEDVPLEQLAATAKLLAERLVVAAERGDGAPQNKARLRLVGAEQPGGSGDPNLAALTRCYLRARRLREGLFPDGMFADPAWDMLLDLYACKIEGTRIGVSNACMAAGVPPTTALRCLNRLEQCGLVQRQPDAVDCRRIYVELTDIAAWRVELWLKTTFLPEAAA